MRKSKYGYVVVRMNSTSGAFVVERAQQNVLSWSKADIAGIYSNKKDAEKEAKRLNRLERNN